ncbi:MAG: hypothetical protein Q8P41_07210 [Pseudomonadota bacterium]|nr:hypothetical protein [Pseudomonadota bacterium]
MAVRHATRRYSDLTTFLREYPSTLGVQALVLPASAFDGEPAPELRIDLVLPIVGRVGPLLGQVVATLPDGGVALRITESSAPVQAAVDQLLGLTEEVKAWLLSSGQLVAPGPAPIVPDEELGRLRARIRELEERIASGGEGSGGGTAAERVRGLRVPPVDHLAPVLSGELADRSLRDALMALAVEKQTGLLTVRRPDGRQRWGFWSKGGPVAWRTEPLEEQEVLGMLLYKAGSLTKEQLAESLAIMERTGCRQGEALVEMGVCTFPQLVLMLQKQADFVLQRVLREREGTWSFHILGELPERFLAPPLRVASILYRALLAHTRDMPAQELASLLRPWLDHYVVLVPGVERTFEEMKLATEEQQFVQIIQRTPYRLRELFAVSSLSRSQTAAALWCLYDLNLLEMQAESSGVRERERHVQELLSRRAASRAKTLFERMDLHWICTGADVTAAYQQLKADWPMELVANLGEEHRATLQEINTVLDEANAVLSSDAKRRDYRKSVIERSKIEQSAEMLAKKGDMAIMKAALREALDCFNKALELVPGHAEYREGLKRARNIEDLTAGGPPRPGKPSAPR